MPNNKVIKVVVRDTENIIFEGEVDRITSYNEVGRFDIYPLHANFISVINQELALYNNRKKIKEIKLEEAVIKVKKDVISIYLGIETLFIGDESDKKPPISIAVK
jgi:F0F1-type ATP synthase epsilon subunit